MTTKRAAGNKRRPVAASAPYEPWLIAQLKEPARAAAYLDAVMDDGDQGAITHALRQVAEAQASGAGAG